MDDLRIGSMTTVGIGFPLTDAQDLDEADFNLKMEKRAEARLSFGAQACAPHNPVYDGCFHSSKTAKNP